MLKVEGDAETLNLNGARRESGKDELKGLGSLCITYAVGVFAPFA